ncbi:MAG: hypothetical protein PH343_07655 [Nitrospira sp.]|nr:hypothetical protein [Nitrospira sp.]
MEEKEMKVFIDTGAFLAIADKSDMSHGVVTSIYQQIKREKVLLPLEVKYQKNVGFTDLRTIKKLGFKRGILISVDKLEMDDGFAIIPAGLFLLATGGDDIGDRP